MDPEHEVIRVIRVVAAQSAPEEALEEAHRVESTFSHLTDPLIHLLHTRPGWLHLTLANMDYIPTLWPLSPRIMVPQSCRPFQCLLTPPLCLQARKYAFKCHRDSSGGDATVVHP